MSNFDIVVVFDGRNIDDPTKAAQKIAQLAIDGDFWFGLGCMFAFKSEKPAYELNHDIGEEFGSFVAMNVHSDTLTGYMPGDHWLRINAEVFRHSFTKLLKNQWHREISEDEATALIEQKKAEVEEAKKLLTQKALEKQ